MLQIAAALLLAQSWGDPPPSWSDAPVTYGQLYAAAVRDGVPLVIGVGCDVPQGEWLTWRAPAKWHSWQGPLVIVAVPKGDTLWAIGSIQPPATAEAVRKLLPKQVPDLPKKKWNPYQPARGSGGC
jgi:hypothetical protein